MIHSLPKHRYRRLIHIMWPVIFVIFACYDTLSQVVQAQPSTPGVTSQAAKGKLPSISKIVFAQTNDTPRYWIKQTRVVSADGVLRMENTKILYSGYWGEGTSEYKLSPDGKSMLVAQEVPESGVSKEHSNLLLVSLTTGKTKTLRGDKTGYRMLGWSSDGQLISYVSPIPLPYPQAGAPTSSKWQLVSYASDKNALRNRHESLDRVLYVSAVDGRRRHALQAKVSDAVWIAGHEVIVYTSYDNPGLVAYSATGKKAVLSQHGGGGQLLMSGDGRRLLWDSGHKLHLLQIPSSSSKLLDPKAWKTVARYELDPRRYSVASGLSHDGTMVTLTGPGKRDTGLLAILDLTTSRFVVYSAPGSVPYRWSRNDLYLISGYAAPNTGGISLDLAAIPVDHSSIAHTGPIEWESPQPVSPEILLGMPMRTRRITWCESESLTR